MSVRVPLEDSLERLESLHARATNRVPAAPAWDHITYRARTLATAGLLLHGLDTADALETAHDAVEASGVYDLLARALEHQYPDGYGSAEALRGVDWSKLEGLQRGAQGGWFEIGVGDAFDSGDLPLPGGAAGWRFPRAGTAGYDVELLSESGDIVGSVQLKATTSLSYIRRTLDRHPDIPIIATSEVAAQARDAGLGDMVIDSGISLSDFPGMDPMRLGLADLNPFSEDFNVDLELLDAAIIAADIVIGAFTGGDLRAATLAALQRGGKRLAREFLLNTVAEAAMQATGTAAAGGVVGAVYASYRIGKTGKVVLDYRHQEVTETTRRVERLVSVLDGLGGVSDRDDAAEAVPVRSAPPDTVPVPCIAP